VVSSAIRATGPPAAEAAFARPVPPELMDYLQKNKLTLWPDLLKLWEAAGAKNRRPWQEVSAVHRADEIFHGVELRRYMEPHGQGRQSRIRAAGLHEHVAGASPRTRRRAITVGLPGAACDDIWKAGAPAIDIKRAGRSSAHFNDWAARFYPPQ